WGIDVTDRGFMTNEMLKAKDLESRVHMSVFTPPKLAFEDNFFSHLVTAEALHLNPTHETMSAQIAECHRVMQPGGRLYASMVTPDYWFIKLGYADWIGTHTVELNQDHPEVARRGARYFVFKTEAEIRKYFAAFSK